MTRSKVFTPLILNTVLFSEWSSAVFISLVIVVHESLVCSEQFNCLLFFRKILQLTLILWFSSIFVYLNPFQQWLWFWDLYFHTEDSWGTHMQLLQKIQTLSDAAEGETFWIIEYKYIFLILLLMHSYLHTLFCLVVFISPFVLLVHLICIFLGIFTPFEYCLI